MAGKAPLCGPDVRDASASRGAIDGENGVIRCAESASPPSPAALVRIATRTAEWQAG